MTRKFNIEDVWRALKPFGLVAIGPIGCYIAYYLLFVARYVSPDEYPLLYDMSRIPTVLIDVAAAISVTFLGLYMASRQRGIDEFKPVRPNLPKIALVLAVAGCAALLLLSIYRVLGTLSPAYVLKNYVDYQFMATYGGAWIIHACYAALLLLLMDMYYGGVTRANSTAFLLSVLIVALSGGRGLLLMLVLTFLSLLMLQRVKLINFLIVAAISAVLMASSFITVTDLRDTRNDGPKLDHPTMNNPQQPEKPQDSFDDLNYNAAFIQEDVLKAFRNGKVEAAPYAAYDARTRLVPRFLMKDKPVSTAETMAIYPEVAARGTNITFPLKANLMMHFGPIGFWLDWLVVAGAAVLALVGAAQRAKKPVFWSFAAIFFGCTFSLIARAGLLNARLLDLVFDIGLAYIGYRVALLVFRPTRQEPSATA
nr:hypothetical protein [Mesorhizobium loti]